MEVGLGQNNFGNGGGEKGGVDWAYLVLEVVELVIREGMTVW